jgi:uncharacterized protein
VRMRVALPLIAMMVGGCGESEQSRYYVLMENLVSDYRTAKLGPATTIALGAVRLPPALDRPQMARRLGCDEISYSEFDRWAGPLDEMVRRVLIADLDGRLPFGLILIENDTTNPARLTISVDILRFDADATGIVQLYARWEVLGRAGRLVGTPQIASIVDRGPTGTPRRLLPR